MAFNIEEFIGNFADRGVLQTNKYDVSISFAGQNNALVGSTVSTDMAGPVQVKDIAQDLSFRCISASLPGMALRTVDSNRFGVGVQEKMPFSGNYTDIDLTFVCDRYGMAYVFWYSWMNYIFSTSGATTQTPVSRLDGNRKFYTTEYKDSYCATITITVYDTAGEKVLTYDLYKAYPIAMNDTAISWGDNNNLLKVTTKITFTEWAMDDAAAALAANKPPAQQTPLQKQNNSALLVTTPATRTA